MIEISKTEFIGTAPLDTIGLVIPSPDEQIKSYMDIPAGCNALGLISSRTGAAGQIMAVDEACKNTNCQLISIDLPRDTKGWGGHGNYIVIGSHSVSDVTTAIKLALELIKKYAGEVHINDAGHLEFAFSSSAGKVLETAFNIPKGQAFGFMAASPAAIGLYMADKSVKLSNITITKYMTPSIGTSHSNEVIIAFTGETSAVKSAILTGKTIGFSLLKEMAGDIISFGEQYIL